MRYLEPCDLEVSRIGLGARGMSYGYAGSGTDEAQTHRGTSWGVRPVAVHGYG